MTSQHEFEATLDVTITHRAGPVIPDRRHVLNWVVADGTHLGGGLGSFEFWVCAEHSDPDECPTDCPAYHHSGAMYGATLTAAALVDA